MKDLVERLEAWRAAVVSLTRAIDDLVDPFDQLENELEEDASPLPDDWDDPFAEFGGATASLQNDLVWAVGAIQRGHRAAEALPAEFLDRLQAAEARARSLAEDAARVAQVLLAGGQAADVRPFQQEAESATRLCREASASIQRLSLPPRE